MKRELGLGVRLFVKMIYIYRKIVLNEGIRKLYNQCIPSRSY